MDGIQMSGAERMASNESEDGDSDGDEVIDIGVGMFSAPKAASTSQYHKVWWSGKINTGGVLRHIYGIPGINESMFYIGQMFTFFGLHGEEEYLGSLSCFHYGAETLWYVIPPELRIPFEKFTDSDVYNTKYLTELKAGSRLANMLKSTMMDPRYIHS